MNQRTFDFIKKMEGESLSPYLDQTGTPTISIGVTKYPNGKKVTLKDKKLTREESFNLFMTIVSTYENAVFKSLNLALNENQITALISFCYNIGITNFKESTLLKRVNKNPYDTAIKTEFAKWIKSKGKILEGLKKRRAREIKLYFTVPSDLLTSIHSKLK